MIAIIMLDDILVLCEWDPSPLIDGLGKYTGRKCVRRVTHVLDGVGSVGAIAPLKGLASEVCDACRLKVSSMSIRRRLPDSRRAGNVHAAMGEAEHGVCDYGWIFSGRWHAG